VHCNLAVEYDFTFVVCRFFVLLGWFQPIHCSLQEGHGGLVVAELARCSNGKRRHFQRVDLLLELLDEGFVEEHQGITIL